jgi:hypothetical protein
MRIIGVATGRGFEGEGPHSRTFLDAVEQHMTKLQRNGVIALGPDRARITKNIRAGQELLLTIRKDLGRGRDVTWH